jgi:putative two-component system response regulator
MNAMRQAGRALILVVDDEQRNVQMLEMMLEQNGYGTVSAADGRTALMLAVDRMPDLILVDAKMPDVDGFETVLRLKADPRTGPIPVIMVTALDDRESKLRALSAGAEEFLSKPIDIAEASVRIRNLLRLKEHRDLLKNYNENLEEQVKERAAQLEEAYRDTVFTLLRAAEYKDEETGRHVRRISYYCGMLAAEMGMTSDFVDAIHRSSPMHDVGKIGIPDHILLKPGRLTQQEWVVMKTHCALGADILKFGCSPYTRMGADIALNHHEHWDGSGYPNGRKGEEIPLAARIMQICDVYDALRSRRPYKPPIDHDSTVNIISHGDGGTLPDHFDPAVLACFLARVNRFEAIYEEYADK